MSDRYKIEWRDAKLVIGLIVGASVAICIAFYFLSQAYYDDRAKDGAVFTEAHIRRVRISFVILMSTLGAAASLATVWPRLVGHSLGIAAGILSMVAGTYGMPKADLNIQIGANIVLYLLGGLFIACSRLSFSKRSRAGWAFLLAMCSVFSVITLFGATKVRNQLDLGLYYVMIVPGLLCVAAVALSMVRREYRESA